MDGDVLAAEQLPGAADLPLTVTLYALGAHLLVDPTVVEAACARAELCATVTRDGRVAALRQLGRGALHPEALISALRLAVRVAAASFAAIDDALAKEHERDAHAGLALPPKVGMFAVQ